MSHSLSLLGGLPHHVFRDWQRQMERPGSRRLRGIGLAALALDEPRDGLIRAERLLLVTLRCAASRSRPVLRLAGFSGRPVPFGFQFGGESGLRFQADLCALPGSNPASGLDTSTSQTVLRAALRLHQRLRRQSPIHAGFVLPRLWAGFPRGMPVTGEGPELVGHAHEKGCTPDELLRRAARSHEGLDLFPLDWTGHLWEHIATVFSELSGFPKYQAGRRATEHDLHGFRGACEFDLRATGSADIPALSA